MSQDTFHHFLAFFSKLSLGDVQDPTPPQPHQNFSNVHFVISFIIFGTGLKAVVDEIVVEQNEERGSNEVGYGQGSFGMMKKTAVSHATVGEKGRGDFLY